MFGDLDSMWDFIGQAPYFITIAFGGSLLLTFTVVKLSQSQALYQWVAARVDVWRAKQARKIRQSMTADITAFLRGRDEQDLSPPEQRIYYRMLESYYAKIESLYGGSGKDQKEQSYERDE